MKKLLLVLFAVSAVTGPALAENPFGFRFGMSRFDVEKSIGLFGLGSTTFIGKTLMVQAADHPQHRYMFNFCEDKLYEASQIFPTNFEQTASFIDASVRSYGQPIYVSAPGSMGSSGFFWMTNLYWKIDVSSYVRLMQLNSSYHIVYQTENACNKVPT